MLSYKRSIREGAEAQKGKEMEREIFEQLKREAQFAQASFSENLLYEVYGKAKMARQLGVIDFGEFMLINHMVINFMNTDKEYLRRQC